jgi:predicted Rossmann-fold nucleotide-binding protein
MIVGVMASGDDSLASEHESLAKGVGSTVAELGFHLLTGGGGGLMKAVGQAFLDTKREILDQTRPAGNLISILRAKDLPQLTNDGKRIWKANADNGLGEIVIRTHLPLSGNKGSDPLSRNHINALTADLVVILPGGSGTLSELQLAFEYGKDIMIFVGEGNVGGKTSGELAKDFRGIEIGRNEQELQRWLKSRKLLPWHTSSNIATPDRDVIG